MNCFSEEQLNKISHLVREIEKLSDVEKLFLYLQLPCGRTEASDIVEGKPKLNGLKSNTDLFAKKPDQETTQTYTWILSHLEVDPNVSLPKQEVYDEYRAFCQANKFEPLCVADFGKAMKHAFPCIKPRRLGQRGNSRYCYSGLRKKYKIQPPNLPDMIEPTFCMDNDCSQAYNQIIKDCRDNPEECPLNRPTFTVNEVMNLKIENNTGHQFPVNGNTNGTNGRDNDGCGTSTASTNFNDDQSSVKQPNSIHHQHQPPPTDIRHIRTNMPPHQTTHMANIHPLTPVSGHEYIPSNPIPISSQSGHHSSASMRCSYSTIIQQPGTPDDDDYQHNYQDIPPTNRHLFSSAPVSHHQQTATSGFTQLQPHPTMKTTNDDSNRLTDANEGRLSAVGSSNNHLVSQPFAIDGLIGGASPSSAAPGMSSGCLQMQFSHMNSSLIDSCASPFQSPASTPYPQMGNYMSPDVQDYYSTSDCLRYTS